MPTVSLLFAAFFRAIWMTEINGWEAPGCTPSIARFEPAFVWDGKIFISARLYSAFGDYFGLIVLDTSGSVLSLRHADFPQGDLGPLARSISLTPFGEVYQVAEGITPGPDTTGYVIIAKWDTSGNLLWSRKALEVPGVEFATCQPLFMDLNSHLYIPVLAMRDTAEPEERNNIGAACWDTAASLVWEWDSPVDSNELHSIALDYTWTPSGSLILVGEYVRRVGSCDKASPVAVLLSSEGEVLKVLKLDEMLDYRGLRIGSLSPDTLLLLVSGNYCLICKAKIFKLDSALIPVDSFTLPIDSFGCGVDAVFDAEGNIYISLTGAGAAVAKVDRDFALKWFKEVSGERDFVGLKLAVSDSFLYLLGYIKSSSPAERTAICLRALSVKTGNVVAEKVWEFPREEIPEPIEVLPLGDSGVVAIISAGPPSARRTVVERLKITPFESGEGEFVSFTEPLSLLPVPGGLRLFYSGRVRLFDPTGRLVRVLDAVPGAIIYLKPGVYFAVGERGEVGKGVVR